MRVLISGGLAIGGPQTHVTILSHVLLEAGAEVTVACASTNWQTPEIKALQATGVRVAVSPFGFGKWKQFGNLYALLCWPFLLRRDYDVVYCIGEGKMHLWASRFVRRGGERIYHEIVECPKPRSAGALVASKMTKLISNSSRISVEMTKSFPGKPVETIPFLTSTEPMPVPSPNCVEPTNTLRVAFLGRIVMHKRPGMLIEQWNNLCQKTGFAPARLDIYGGDYGTPLVDVLRQKILERGLEDHIRLHGDYPIQRLPEILSRTDMVVLPSSFEGLPLVLVEAMLRGIPIVATSAGGCRELGEENPDVIITPGTAWNDFAVGMVQMAKRIRTGNIDPVRLHAWTEERYGFSSVSQKWRGALLQIDRK